MDELQQQQQATYLSKNEFWMRVAAWSFGLWSLMIPLGVYMLQGAFQQTTKANVDAAREIALFNQRFEQYVLVMERRMILVEERQNVVLRAIADLQTKSHTAPIFPQGK